MEQKTAPTNRNEYYNKNRYILTCLRIHTHDTKATIFSYTIKQDNIS